MTLQAYNKRAAARSAESFIGKIENTRGGGQFSTYNYKAVKYSWQISGGQKWSNVPIKNQLPDRMPRLELTHTLRSAQCRAGSGCFQVVCRLSSPNR